MLSTKSFYLHSIIKLHPKLLSSHRYFKFCKTLHILNFEQSIPKNYLFKFKHFCEVKSNASITPKNQKNILAFLKSQRKTLKRVQNPTFVLAKDQPNPKLIIKKILSYTKQASDITGANCKPLRSDQYLNTSPSLKQCSIQVFYHSFKWLESFTDYLKIHPFSFRNLETFSLKIGIHQSDNGQQGGLMEALDRVLGHKYLKNVSLALQPQKVQISWKKLSNIHKIKQIAVKIVWKDVNLLSLLQFINQCTNLEKLTFNSDLNLDNLAQKQIVEMLTKMPKLKYFYLTEMIRFNYSNIIQALWLGPAIKEANLSFIDISAMEKQVFETFFKNNPNYNTRKHLGVEKLKLHVGDSLHHIKSNIEQVSKFYKIILAPFINLRELDFKVKCEFPKIFYFELLQLFPKLESVRLSLLNDKSDFNKIEQFERKRLIKLNIQCDEPFKHIELLGNFENLKSFQYSAQPRITLKQALEILVIISRNSPHLENLHIGSLIGIILSDIQGEALEKFFSILNSFTSLVSIKLGLVSTKLESFMSFEKQICSGLRKNCQKLKVMDVFVIEQEYKLNNFMN